MHNLLLYKYAYAMFSDDYIKENSFVSLIQNEQIKLEKQTASNVLAKLTNVDNVGLAIKLNKLKLIDLIDSEYLAHICVWTV